jgi:hypothetical protein
MVELGDVAVGSVAPGDQAVAIATEDDVDRRVAVEPAREELRVRVGVDHPGAIRGGHELVREDVLQARHLTHRRLTVVGAEDDRVSLEELVGAARGSDQRPDGFVTAGQRGVCRIRPLDVRGVVVVGEIEDGGSRSRPWSRASGRPPLRRRRSSRASGAHGERRAGHVRLEEVVEEEPARAVRRTGEEGDGRRVRRRPGSR